MPKRATKQAKTRELSFEQALADLEQLVGAMEEDQLPLESLIEHYEKGAGLLAHCEKVLASARQRIELTTLDPIATQTAPGDQDEDPENDRAGNGQADADDDEIRLF